MLLAVVLLYVGAVLFVNGIGLIGQARVAAAGEGGADPSAPSKAVNRRRSSTYVGIAKYSRPYDEYDGIEYSGLPKKPIHVRYHQMYQGISDKPELPIIHQVRDAPMMR
jgi:hypothetical protein